MIPIFLSSIALCLRNLKTAHVCVFSNLISSTYVGWWVCRFCPMSPPSWWYTIRWVNNVTGITSRSQERTFRSVVGEFVVGETKPSLLEVFHSKPVSPLGSLYHEPVQKWERKIRDEHFYFFTSESVLPKCVRRKAICKCHFIRLKGIGCSPLLIIPVTCWQLFELTAAVHVCFFFKYSTALIDHEPMSQKMRWVSR